MSSGRSGLRITVELMELGFLTGGACGLFAFLPMLLVTQRGPGPFNIADLLIVLLGFAMVGAMLGTLFGPILGWVNVRRVPLRRIVLETTLGTIVGEVVLGPALTWIGGLPVDSLMLGGILGAAIATARLRIFSSRYQVAHSTTPLAGR